MTGEPGKRERPEDRLDELLERAGRVEPPSGLAAEVGRGLAKARGDALLDRLLDVVPEPRVPADLPSRVRAGLAGERRPASAQPAPGRRMGGRPAALLVAAALVLALGVVFALRRASGPREPASELARSAPDPALLDALDALENWELLTSDDVDLLLAGLDDTDATLLELDAEDPEPEAGSPDPERKG